MMLNNNNIYLNEFQHTKKGKDGKRPVYIKVRKANDRRYQTDVSVYHTNAKNKLKPLRLTEAEFKKRTVVSAMIIERTKSIINEYFEIYVSHSYKDLKSFVKSVKYETITSEVDLIQHAWSYEPPYDGSNEELPFKKFDPEVVEELNNLTKDEPFLLMEDLSMHYNTAEAIVQRKKEIKQSKLIKDRIERCKAQYKIEGFADSSKIVHCFGKIWLKKTQGGIPYLKKEQLKIPQLLFDFIVNSNESDKIIDFDYNWLSKFFIHMRDVGYSNTHQISATPLEWEKYESKFKNAPKKIYNRDSFDDLFKRIKPYIKELKKSQMIQPIDLDDFIPSNFHLSTTKSNANYFRKDYYLNHDEIQTLVNYNFNNDLHSLARDWFIIQTFASGLRGLHDKRGIMIPSALIKLKYSNNKVVEIDARHNKTDNYASISSF